MKWDLFFAAALLVHPGPGSLPVRMEIGHAAHQLSFNSGFSPVVKRCLPAVVNISSSKLVRAHESPLVTNPVFRQFFDDKALKEMEAPREVREQSLGSGVIVSSDGYILTNSHLVDGAGHVKVSLSDHREFEARVVGRDPETDIAVLKVPASGLPFIPLGDSSKVQAGDFVLAIGNPFGLSQTVTMGIVSAVGRGDLGIEDYEDFIQTDAAINPGNSGGALVNADGELIGINTALVAGGDSSGNQGIGFSIPVNLARGVLTQIVKTGRVVRARLGVTAQSVSAEMAKAFGLTGDPRGALIGDIEANGPAQHAGLKVGDIVLSVNGSPVRDSSSLSLRIAEMAPRTDVLLVVLRNGTEKRIPVTLGEEPAAPAEKPAAALASADRAAILDGIDVSELTADLENHLHLTSGTRGVVVTSLNSTSLAAAAGLQEGDVIEQVNRKPVESVPAYRDAARLAGGDAVLLFVNRGGATRFVVIAPE
jgi:serine protease Do